jgi:YVTN family beta-propeller protein
VTVIDGATNGVIATVTVGSYPVALCYNPTNNKVYCANRSDGYVSVIDGATDSVIATVTTGDHPKVLCYNPTNNKVYCANGYSDNVTVIDGATNGVIATIGVGAGPIALAWNSVQNRVYVANYKGSSISVLGDSVFAGADDALKPALRSKPLPTIVRRVLFLPAAASHKPQAASLLDISGRKVVDLHAGANDLRALAPGVYFVREAQAQAIRKVVKLE